MKILVACEESQNVTKELRRRGHEAYSCDIIECSGGHPEWHIKADALPLLNGNCEFWTQDKDGRGVSWHQIIGKWDMIIAFPPCTHLAVSGARHFEKKRADGRQREGIEFFCQFLNADCDRIAIENPVGIISGDYIERYFPDLAEKYGLPRKPSQIIQPYEYGDPHKKTTCLWLKGLSELQPTNIVEPKLISYECKNGKKVTFSEYMVKGFEGDRAKHRSKTFPGIATAMADQWCGNIMDLIIEQPKAEAATLSDALEDITTEIIEETTEEETMKQRMPTIKENTPADFCAVAQLRRLAEERQALANLRPEDPRFSNDVRAIEYAVNVLEAVGL